MTNKLFMGYNTHIDNKTSSDKLVALSKHPSISIATRAIVHPNLPYEYLLEVIKQNVNDQLISYAALSPNLTEVGFELLANNTSKYVLRSVASNPKCPVSILWRLSESQDDWVLWGVVKNPNLPSEILRKLATKDYLYIRELVVQHPNCPIEIKFMHEMEK